MNAYMLSWRIRLDAAVGLPWLRNLAFMATHAIEVRRRRFHKNSVEMRHPSSACASVNLAPGLV